LRATVRASRREGDDHAAAAAGQVLLEPDVVLRQLVAELVREPASFGHPVCARKRPGRRRQVREPVTPSGICVDARQTPQDGRWTIGSTQRCRTPWGLGGHNACRVTDRFCDDI
jgi:hypothetical protein